jgi:hypothetical protein
MERCLDLRDIIGDGANAALPPSEEMLLRKEIFKFKRSQSLKGKGGNG